MPSNYTQNYKLNQWEPEDRVLRADFNADNAKIDTALAGLSGELAGKADQAALEAEIKARTSALDTVNTALNRCGNCRIAAFTYTGRGGSTNVISFSGTPAFFILAGEDAIVCGGGPGGVVASVYNVSGRSANTQLNATWSGNTLTLYGDIRSIAYQEGTKYQAVAFYIQSGK